MKGLSYGNEGVNVVLVGISTYDDPLIDDLPTVHNNLKDLRSIFEEEDIIGLNSPSVHVFEDINQPSQLSVKINEISARTHDTLIIYYAGHGKIGMDGELLLTVQESLSSSIDFSSLTYSTLKKIILTSPAKKKIVILDCCFSGRAVNYMGAEKDLLQSTEVFGTYVLTSVPENSLAKAVDEDGEYTAFTGALIKLLENGVEGSGKVLSIDDLYSELKRSDILFNKPLRSKSNGIENFKFAYNRARKARISFELCDGYIKSTSNACMSRMTMQKLRVFELKNGIHQQRFILISKFYMNHLGLNEGDWIDIEVRFDFGKVTTERSAVFSKPASDYYREYSMYFTLAMRNLLEIKEKGSPDSASIYKIVDKSIVIRPATLSPQDSITFNSTEFICRIPITEIIQNHKRDKPFIAIRALEFELMGIKELDLVSVKCLNKKDDKVYEEEMYAMILKDNPGRAVCGISKFELDKILSFTSDFNMIISKI